MKKSFKNFFEAVDIFGFDSDQKDSEGSSELEDYPIHQFDVELMMKLLMRKRLGLHEADYSGFMNEVIWGGDRPGAVKLEVDTGYTFHIKRLNFDLEGNKRWATKKVFQLNRRGIAGYEDLIANEVYESIQRLHEREIDYPQSDYDGIEKLTWRIANKMRRVSKPVFLFKGIKKLSEHCYHIIFELRAGGVGTADQNQIDQNVTQISFDEVVGVLRINNYNIESPTGGDHKWQIMPSDLDVYFYPTQSMDEIAEAMSVHFKYY